MTTQVVVQGSGGRSVLRFHQEWLADAAERERQREFWRSVVDRAEQDLSA